MAKASKDARQTRRLLALAVIYDGGMLLMGEGESADDIVGGAEWSTLAHDASPVQEFDLTLVNPPYGKS